MSSYIRTAVIEGFDNAPPLDTGVPAELQLFVDLGATGADEWIDLKGAVRLRDYAATQVSALANELTAIAEEGDFERHRVQASSEAFVAGLLGRVQQRLFAALGVNPRDRQSKR
ncbi:hypothetical protein NX868_06935 [Burkholderia thailandensis]|uniref:hypothetical protein n=1 Tax=Burkholderia thailandensis TaxID=57975 RepID=UPI000473896D|nr:hypothetical protein [Burkholderia thailandensis]MCS3395412.1 hypothetical protein [Burkholderia thailandensis]MCS6424098.1 hypothetical protein [Burkholderia thailandensis]MCS6456782.1 hypothetical protein [Burkholderia thailandensis]MCS6464250.1 hypothetical protein [Burkholderia thailandensis]MCS6482017.1 hypothetical protein [Burkholderia thailandensis]